MLLGVTLTDFVIMTLATFLQLSTTIFGWMFFDTGDLQREKSRACVRASKQSKGYAFYSRGQEREVLAGIYPPHDLEMLCPALKRDIRFYFSLL